MIIFVKMSGVLMMGIGVAFLIKPDSIKKYLNFWKQGNRLYAAGAINLIIGSILLFAASQCRISWFVTLFGIIAVIKGVYLIVAGPAKAMSMMNWWLARPPAFLRIYVVVLALAFGVLLIYCS